MSQAIIRRLFEDTLNTWAAAKVPPLTIAWQNRTLDPQPTTLYLQAFLLPIPTQSLDLEGKHRQWGGLFQINIDSPIAIGSGAAEVIVAELEALFPVSTPLVLDDMSVFIAVPISAARALDRPDRYVVPVTCTYTAHTLVA